MHERGGFGRFRVVRETAHSSLTTHLQLRNLRDPWATNGPLARASRILTAAPLVRHWGEETLGKPPFCRGGNEQKRSRPE